MGEEIEVEGAPLAFTSVGFCSNGLDVQSASKTKGKPCFSRENPAEAGPPDGQGAFQFWGSVEPRNPVVFDNIKQGHLAEL